MESKIAGAITNSLKADRSLSKKAIARIEKSAGKLSEKLKELFDKEDKVAKSKASKEKATYDGK